MKVVHLGTEYVEPRRSRASRRMEDEKLLNESSQGSWDSTEPFGTGENGGSSALGLILLALIMAAGVMAMMHLGRSSIDDKAYAMEGSNIQMAQSIFAGENTAACTATDKMAHSGLRIGVSYEVTFHCNGNGAKPIPGKFHTDVTEKEFNAIQVGKPYQVKVVDWGTKPNLPKFAVTTKN